MNENDSEQVDKSEGSRVTTHTVERREIRVSHRVYSTSSDGAASSSSSNLHPLPLPLPVSADLRSTQPIIERGYKHYGYRMRLYCRTGYCLMILSDGSVHGDELGVHPGGVLEFSSAGIGEVRIRAVDVNLYLAMNKMGNLYGEEDPRDYATVFVEGTMGQYNTYLSQKYAHLGWYIGIKKNGTIKKGPLTKWGQKAIQFLPVRNTGN